MTYTEPIFVILILVITVGALRRNRRLTLAGVLALVAVSWAPVVWIFSQPLEAWYSPDPPLRAEVEAIVLLSGHVVPAGRGQPFPMPSNNTYQRALYSAWLQHKLGKPVLACGGNPGPPYTESYAATMKRTLVGEGVPPDMVWLEERSRSTYENAVFAAEILRARHIHRIALVTEAWHMLRADGCFRKQGLDVIPAPTGFRGLDFTLSDFVPSWNPIRQTELLLHEGIGLLWYRLQGRL